MGWLNSKKASGKVDVFADLPAGPAPVRPRPQENPSMPISPGDPSKGRSATPANPSGTPQNAPSGASRAGGQGGSPTPEPEPPQGADSGQDEAPGSGEYSPTPRQGANPPPGGQGRAGKRPSGSANGEAQDDGQDSASAAPRFDPKKMTWEAYIEMLETWEAQGGRR